MSKILTDHISLTDKINTNHKRTFWARTEIIGGYGLHKNKLGISELDEVVFTTENMVPLIGVQYAMEQIFGVKGSLTPPTLNDTMGIGAQGSTIVGDENMPYPYGQRVCLFGVGTGGAAENNLTALEVKYNETSIVDMVPFRYTNDVLAPADQFMYYGKKMENDITAYYLKRFDTETVIRHCFKNGEEGEDGSEVDNTYFTSHNEIGVQSFAESCLTITKKDVREWFDYLGNIEQTRINSIALFTAVFDKEQNDYANIQLFSKLNIPTEPLSLTKDMNIIYRVYGA